jgi:hypothetical protein
MVQLSIVLFVTSLQLEYFETVLHTYYSTEAQQALKSLQENLLEKACESVAEALENPGHNRRPTRGSEDAASDDKQGSSVSPDDLLVSTLRKLLLKCQCLWLVKNIHVCPEIYDT